MHRLSPRLPRSPRHLPRPSPLLILPSALPRTYPALPACHHAASVPSPYPSRRHASTYSRKLSSAVHPRDAGRVRQKFKLADIGEGIKEVEIVKWHVEEGQEVQEFDPIVEVMSDKATVEITSPYSGVLRSPCGEVGTIAQVGGVLCEIETEGEAGGAAEVAEPNTPGTSDAVNEAYRATVPPTTTAHPPPPTPSPASPASSWPPSGTLHDDSHVLASPTTRRVARDNGVDLTAIPTAGTGKGGRLLPADVLAFVKSLATPAAASPASGSGSGAPASAPAGQPIALSPLRRAMFKAMTASLAIPHFAYSETLDVTAVSRLRVELNKSIPLRYRATLSPAEERVIQRQQQWGGLGRVPEGQRFDKLTLMPLLVKGLSLAMEENPLFLCSLAGGGEGSEPHLVPRGQHDISVALASPSAHGGLFTPVLAGVDSLSTFDVAARLTELQAAAAATALSGGVPAFPKAAQGRATLTLSNIGATGGRGTHPVIPPTGQLAIGAMGRVRVEAGYRPEDEGRARRVAMGEEEEGAEGLGLGTEPRLRMDVSFCADHRVVEGVELARLVETWKRLVERPERLVGVAR